MGIYLDYQATSPVDSQVLQKMLPFFSECFGNPHSGEHVFGWNASNEVDAATVRLATILGVGADELCFTSGATEANNLAIQGSFTHPSRAERRVEILVGAAEHKSVIEAASNVSRRFGARVRKIPVLTSGELDIDWLRDNISSETFMVSAMAINNEVGAINHVEDIGEIAHSNGALFHCDMSQAPCTVDIEALMPDVDMASLSAHKIYGPKGIGLFFVRSELRGSIEPMFYGGGQQGGLRAGTVPVSLCVGMAEALGLLHAARSSERERVASLREMFFERIQHGLAKTCQVRLNGPTFSRRHVGNLNIQVEGIDAEDLIGRLQPRVAISTGSACNSGFIEPSGVLLAMGLSESQAKSSFRVSIGRFTNEAEVIEATEAVVESCIEVANCR